MNRLEVYAYCDRGAVREANEDCILLGREIRDRGVVRLDFEADDELLLDRGLLLAVADGIGGESGGAVASHDGLKAFEQHFYAAESRADLAERLESAGRHANEILLDKANSHSELEKMGSTLSGVCLRGPRIHVFNCGDSRVYRHRHGFIKRLTDDHTVAACAIRESRLTSAEAASSELRHHLTNHIGLHSCRLVVEPGPELRDHDTLLVCSDGLHGMVDDDTIAALLSSPGGSLEAIGENLVEQAMANGGHDNISIVLARANGASDE